MPITSKASAETKQFLRSQSFSDGLKITFGILLPSVLLYQFDLIETGIAFSLGALCVSITDNPGPLIHKRNAMLFTIPLIFIISFLTGLLNRSSWLLAIEIGILSFLFSMFNVYGARAGTIGTAALIIMVLGIDHPLSIEENLIHSAYIAGGGIWYMLLSLSLNRIFPYRAAQQTLSEAANELAEYLEIKALYYDSDEEISAIQAKLIAKQIKVHEHFEHVREIMFKTRKLFKDASPTSRKLILSFVDIVELFEQATATHYDYAELRQNFRGTLILPEIGQSIRSTAIELRHISHGFRDNSKIQPIDNLEIKLNQLKVKVDTLDDAGLHVMQLRKITLNLLNMGKRLQQIYSYAEYPEKLPGPGNADFSKFVTHQKFDFRLFSDNLNTGSAHFRHALRMAIVCLFTFLVALPLHESEYGYWILLTVVVILKPGFSLTKQLNYERVLGTLIGGLAGAAILYFIQDKTILFICMMLFMILSYSFIRLKYFVGVLFMTPFILIMFSFISVSSPLDMAQERILDTVIGALIAGVASYFIFPAWESFQIQKMMAETVLKNANYLSKMFEMKTGDYASTSAYRLSRKQMNLSQANLAAAFQRMLEEPKSKQKNAPLIQRFIILNHIFSGYVATITQHKHETGHILLSEEQVRTIRKSLALLREAYELLGGKPAEWPEFKPWTGKLPEANGTHNDPVYALILKTAGDICRESKP